MRLLAVEVLLPDIEEGEPLNPCNCPIQTGIVRALNDAGFDRAGVQFLGEVAIIRLTPGERSRVVWMPREAMEWMARYDQGLYVEPFAFTFDLNDIAEGWDAR
jgi:hypothetical protein